MQLQKFNTQNISYYGDGSEGQLLAQTPLCTYFPFLSFVGTRPAQDSTYSLSMLSWALIKNSRVEFAVCEVRNFSAA